MDVVFARAKATGASHGGVVVVVAAVVFVLKGSFRGGLRKKTRSRLTLSRVPPVVGLSGSLQVSRYRLGCFIQSNPADVRGCACQLGC